MEKFDGWHRHFYKLSYCDVPFWTYQTESIETIFYCPEDSCWGHGDAGHPPEDYLKTCVSGLGIFEDRTHVEGPHYSFRDKIIYFKKGELVCGEEMVGVNEKNEQKFFQPFRFLTHGQSST